jgi:NhaA family Na+:H+ antiporter
MPAAVAEERPGSSEASLPEKPVDRFVGPFTRFLHVEAAGGVVLVIATAAALILANSPLAEPYLAIWKTDFTVGIGSFQMSHSLKHWISDGLMGIFFFVIGLEVKRELVLGELRELRKAALPIAAALGGMIVPAGLYLALQLGEPGERGWGIPMATDIAFVVGCLAVLGSRVPASLRVLLLSLAIADDIGAILVIAIGYTESLSWNWLALGLVGIAVVRGMAQLGVRSVPLYVVVGGFVWLGFHESGVHATIAGVILGIMTPATSWLSGGRLRLIVQEVDGFLHGTGWPSAAARLAMLRRMETAARETLSPLERLENALHPWQSFVIIPLFALANAGVPFRLSDFGDPVAGAVALGLALGKPVGIVLFSWIAVRAGLARLPEDLSWGVLAGGGCLAGIGFTMALFIAGLALEGDALDAAKVGILGGSAISAALGLALLLALLPRSASAARDA